MEPLFYKMDLDRPRDEVFGMWTDESGLTAWLCLRANVEAVVGGAYELFFGQEESRPESDSTSGCRVLSIDRPRLLVFSWRGPDELADVMNAPDAPATEVKVEFFPTPDGTRLEVTHSGWGEGEGWRRARQWFDRAWSNALEKLRMVVRSPARDKKA